MTTQIPLTDAKTRLSEIVRTVRRTGGSVTITVDGEPAAQLAPVEGEARDLTEQEIATVRALTRAVLGLPRPSGPFDAIELVGEGRR